MADLLRSVVEGLTDTVRTDVDDGEREGDVEEEGSPDK